MLNKCTVLPQAGAARGCAPAMACSRRSTVSVLSSVPGSSRRSGLGLARVETVSFHVAEDEVGAYDAPGPKVTMPGPRCVWVRPLGTLVVGARGVVEMACGHGRGLLLLNRRGVWKLRADPRKASSSLLVVLDENEFARALMQLIL